MLHDDDLINVKMPFRPGQGLGVLARQEFLEKARKAALRLSRENGKVTIDDVKKVVGHPPEGIPDTVWGGVFKGRNWHQIGRRRRNDGSEYARRFVTIWRYGTKIGRWKKP